MPTDSTDGRRDAGDEGSATVEFILLAVLLLIPVIYFLVLTSQIQAAAYASVAAADQAAKSAVAVHDPTESAGRIQQVVDLTLADYGHGGGTHEVQVACSSSPCLEPGSSVTVSVDVRVPLPFIPSFLGWDTSAATVTSSSWHVVPRFG